MTDASAPSAPAPAEAMLDRLVTSTVHTLELFCLHVGDQLGFYAALDRLGPATSTELANRAGTNERSTHVWLEQQATAGYLDRDNPEQDARDRRYVLPDGYAALLVDRESLLIVTPLAQIAASAVTPLHEPLAAFRGGVAPYANYGHDLHEG